MNHLPWNYTSGPSDGDTADLYAQQRTIKTRCNMRVPLNAADASKRLDCALCMESIAAEKEFILEQAVALNDLNIIHSIAYKTLEHAISHTYFEQTPFAAAELMLQAQEQLTREHFPEMYA